SAVRIGDDSDFSFDEGIVVTSIATAKGVEFPNVLIWNPPRDSRKLLYVGITRAEDLLAIATWGKVSPLLPPPGLKLTRVVDEEEPEEAEESIAPDGEDR